MSLKLVTPPTETPVTLDEAKAHLRVDTTDDDALIESLIQVATAYLDGKDGLLNRALKPQVYELTFDAFPSEIALQIGPVISVDIINYDNVEGVELPVEDNSYELDNSGNPAWIVRTGDFDWPDTLAAANAVRVRFTAGYADDIDGATTVPAVIRHAILVLVADLFEHRESVSADGYAEIPIPAVIRNLVHAHRVFL